MTQHSEHIASPATFHLPAVATFVNRRWWWTTLLVLLALGVLVRLGFWQLDRREQRLAYNAQIRQQLAQPPLVLNEDESLMAAPAEAWNELKNRQVTVQGAYDLSRQMALTFQNLNSTPGFHFITPLVIDGIADPTDGRPRAVLIDRGWVPIAEQPSEFWSRYDVTGPLAVTGYIKSSQTLPGAMDESEAGWQPEWYRVDIPKIQAQMPYHLLPVYLQQAPGEAEDTLPPYRMALDAGLSEGNHLSYAIQWFIFATILLVGYVYFVGRNTPGIAGENKQVNSKSSTPDRTQERT
jgi:surfeit locus 1 family protein